MSAEPTAADLVIRNARCVATMDGERRELDGGWVAVTDGLISAVGTGEAPAGRTTIDLPAQIYRFKVAKLSRALRRNVLDETGSTVRIERAWHELFG